MNIIVPKTTNIEGLTNALKSVGLGIMSKKGNYVLVNRDDHPEIFAPEAFLSAGQPVETKDTQDLSP